MKLLLVLLLWLLNFLVSLATTVTVSQSCYDQTPPSISVAFDAIADTDTEGVWIGLYEAASVPSDTLSLPPHSQGLLKAWILTCGLTDGCDPWPSTGSVTFEAFNHPSGTYVAVVSGAAMGPGAANPLQAQAVSNPFLIVNVAAGDSCPTPTTSPSSSPTQRPTESPTISPSIAPVSPTQMPTPRPHILSDSDNAFFFLDQARTNIQRALQQDPDLLGQFLRLVFHDCVGGCDGCVDLTDPDNAGLDHSISILEGIQQSLGDQTVLTRTDLWMLSGLVASEVALPEEFKGMEFSTAWLGRPTCESNALLQGRLDCGTNFVGNIASCSARTGKFVPLCHGVSGTQTILDFFDSNFGFDAQQTTAIMGAHSVGRMNRQNSGHEGTWDLSPHSLDVGYWIELAAGPDFELRQVQNGDLRDPNGEPIPDRLEWVALLDDPNANVIMLNSDLALVRNLPEVDQVGCRFMDCDRNTPFMPHVGTFKTYIF